MQAGNNFQFRQSPYLPDIRVLAAAMSDFSYERHSHEEYSIGVTLAGNQDFFHNGNYYSSEPGTVIVFNPEDVHDGHPGSDETLRYRMIYLHPDQLQPLLETVGARQHGPFHFNRTLVQDDLLRQVVLQQVVRLEAADTSRLELESGLYQIAERLCQLNGEYESCNRVNRPDALLTRVKDYIEAHLQDDLSLDDLSRQVHLSKYHFLRLFRKQCGMTPYQYVLNRRISRARKALEAGQALDDVVYQFGFSDLSHFNRRFKPIYGATPKQYQRYLFGY